MPMITVLMTAKETIADGKKAKIARAMVTRKILNDAFSIK